MRPMRSIYLSQAFASEAVFMHLLFAPLGQNLSKPRNLSYFPLKIRSRPKKGEKRPRLRTERLDFWVSKIARLREDTTQKTTTIFCPQRHQTSRVTTLQKHRHPGFLVSKFRVPEGPSSNSNLPCNESSPSRCQRG